MWWFFWSIEQQFKEQNDRLDKLEKRVDDIVLCLKAIADKLK